MYFPMKHAWTGDETLGEHLERQGVGRRDFLRFCGEMSVMLGLSQALTPRIVEALQAQRRPSVVWLQLQECTGCVESALRTADPTIGDLLLDVVSLDYNHTLMAAAGHAAEAALQSAMEENFGEYMLIVTGSVPLEENGIYLTIGGRTGRVILEEAAEGAAAVIAVGACAHFGSVQAARPNPTGAVGVSQIVRDKPVVTIAGCPPIADVITATIVHYLTFGRMPAMDARAGRCSRTARASTTSARGVPTSTRDSSCSLRRRGRAARLVPVRGGLQGARDVLAVPDLPVERPHGLADRRGTPVPRVHRAVLLGHDDALLRATARRRRLRRRAERRPDRGGARGGHRGRRRRARDRDRHPPGARAQEGHTTTGRNRPGPGRLERGGHGAPER
jgi:coenzyme F420-reducing hydrogenase gamma subunit